MTVCIQVYVHDMHTRTRAHARADTHRLIPNAIITPAGWFLEPNVPPTNQGGKGDITAVHQSSPAHGSQPSTAVLLPSPPPPLPPSPLASAFPKPPPPPPSRKPLSGSSPLQSPSSRMPDMRNSHGIIVTISPQSLSATTVKVIPNLMHELLN